MAIDSVSPDLIPSRCQYRYRPGFRLQSLAHLALSQAGLSDRAARQITSGPGIDIRLGICHGRRKSRSTAHPGQDKTEAQPSDSAASTAEIDTHAGGREDPLRLAGPCTPRHASTNVPMPPDAHHACTRGAAANPRRRRLRQNVRMAMSVSPGSRTDTVIAFGRPPGAMPGEYHTAATSSGPRGSASWAMILVSALALPPARVRGSEGFLVTVPRHLLIPGRGALNSLRGRISTLGS